MSQVSHFCGMCDIFVAGGRPQCDILEGSPEWGVFGRGRTVVGRPVETAGGALWLLGWVCMGGGSLEFLGEQDARG